MSNFTKQWRSEYHLGGKVRVQRLGMMIIVTFGDEDAVNRQYLSDNGAMGRIIQFLEENTSYYWAEKITNFINQKLSNTPKKKAIGNCNRCGALVYKSDNKEYSAQCFEHDEDLFDFEWTPLKNTY